VLSATSATIVVHVAGAVVEPGVYRVAANARVVDAVTAAGGATAEGRADALNLAAPLRDGDRVQVPTHAEAPTVVAGVSSAVVGGSAAAAGSTGPLDVNVATVDELDRLPGVGPATAAAIVAHREANGPFPTIDAIGDVRGIGPAKLEALRPLVTL
jgi:competence protein ComEA